MAEEQNEVDIPPADDVEEGNPDYKIPEKKTVEEIQKLDADDDSLVRYKQKLLGAESIDPPFPDKPDNVVMSELSLVVEGRDDFTIDLKVDPAVLKKNKITIKEGIQYRLRISFYVQREIASGLKYYHRLSRKGIKVDSTMYMIGSYAPSRDPHHYNSPVEDAPEGMLSRGNYDVHSTFIDDDGNKILSWDWTFAIKRDWN